MGDPFIFATTITFYGWLVQCEKKCSSSGNPEEIAKVIRGGVTEEMVRLSWKYEMY
jgi:hypothetical protein